MIMRNNSCNPSARRRRNALLVRALLAGVLGLLSACAQAPARPDAPAAIAAHDTARAPRRVLVTFHDESITRTVVGDSSTQYRRRGLYQNTTWSQTVAHDLAQAYGLKEVAGWPITTLGVFCAVYELSDSQSIDDILKLLVTDARVQTAQRMNVFKSLNQHYSDPYFRLQSGLRSIQLAAAHRWTTGREVTVAVIDAGIDARHPDLQGQVLDNRNYVAPDAAAEAADIHGTAVAGIIAALANNGQGIVGIAPHAKLIGLKACWPTEENGADAVCDSLSLAQALNAAIQLKPRILNLSLTGPADPLLTTLLERVIAQGTIVVAADPGDADSTPRFPLSLAQVIAVRTCSSSANAQSTALKAPGVEVLTTLPQAGYNFMSGASFAAAHVSGIIALLLELRPELSTAEATQLLRDSVVRVGLRHGTEPALVESVNACHAVAKLRGLDLCGNTAAAAMAAAGP